MDRGDIYLVSMDPTSGHEQKGRRPVLVVTSSASQSHSTECRKVKTFHETPKMRECFDVVEEGSELAAVLDGYMLIQNGKTCHVESLANRQARVNVGKGHVDVGTLAIVEEVP